MSRYSGRYYRGASRDMRERKRIEAETRDTKRYRNGGYIDGPGAAELPHHDEVVLEISIDTSRFTKALASVTSPSPALTGINGYPLRGA